MPQEPTARKRRFGLTARTLLGMGLGIAAGLFFGEWCSWLKFVGDAFVGLLQMTVLPYICLSLIASAGRLAPDQARRLGGRVGLVLITLWGLGLALVVLTASVFPDRQTPSFYSNAVSQTPEQLNLLQLFIPTNPFCSLANNWIPGVVVFCLGLGMAVMAMPGKENLIARLDDWLTAITRLNRASEQPIPSSSPYRKRARIEEFGWVRCATMLAWPSSALCSGKRNDRWHAL